MITKYDTTVTSVQVVIKKKSFSFLTGPPRRAGCVPEAATHGGSVCFILHTCTLLFVSICSVHRWFVFLFFFFVSPVIDDPHFPLHAKERERNIT